MNTWGLSGQQDARQAPEEELDDLMLSVEQVRQQLDEIGAVAIKRHQIRAGEE